MADIKISQLPAAAAATGSMEFEVNDNGNSRKVTGSQIEAHVLGSNSGFLVRTAAGEKANRSIEGSASVTVAEGDGSEGNPQITVNFASKPQAEAGTAADVAMNPVRTMDSIKANAGGYREFLISGTWTKPANARWVYVELTGGGGGGGSGRRGAASTNKVGGGGGGGAPKIFKFFAAADLSSTVLITVGGAGAGAAAVTADTTNGGDGGDGGSSSFGEYLAALGGGGGKGGGTSPAAGGDGRGWYGASAAANTKGTSFEGTLGGATDRDLSTIYGGAAGGGASSSAGGFTGSSSVFSGAGGGGGGGENASNVTFSPGLGGGIGSYIYGGGGGGGRGGNSWQTVPGESGYNGQVGCGGGGGGASRNGFNSGGAGGNGGSGRVRIWWGV